MSIEKIPSRTKLQLDEDFLDCEFQVQKGKRSSEKIKEKTCAEKKNDKETSAIQRGRKPIKTTSILGRTF